MCSQVGFFSMKFDVLNILVKPYLEYLSHLLKQATLSKEKISNSKSYA